MTTAQSLRIALREIRSGKAGKVDKTTKPIFAALEKECPDLIEHMVSGLRYSAKELVSRRPDAADVVGTEYLALCIWLGRRSKELEGAESEAKPPRARRSRSRNELPKSFSAKPN